MKLHRIIVEVRDSQEDMSDKRFHVRVATYSGESLIPEVAYDNHVSYISDVGIAVGGVVEVLVNDG